MPALTLTRQQLYDRVWTTPIDTLAKELGLSGRGLGKLCARHNIPVPPRGYWAKKVAGKRVSQPPLPARTTPHEPQLSFSSGSTSEPDHNPPEAEVHPLIAFERIVGHDITVPDDLTLTDPIALKTQRLLRRAKREPQGLIAVPAGGLHVHTSRALHDRALRVMQALLSAFGARGFPVTVTPDGIRVAILDESLGFGITEATKAVEHRTSFTEQKLIDRGLGWQVPKRDHVPAGALTFVITNVGHVRQRWSENYSKRLEDLVNTFIVGLVRAAIGLKRQRAEAERREHERQESERKRQDEQRRQAEIALRWREERGKVERLERLAAIWRRNRRLRRLLEELQVAVGNIDGDSELGGWLAWAADHVEDSDPLRHLRERTGKTLTLYYHEYDHDRIPQRGFQEPEPASYGQDKTKAGVELTARPPEESLYGYERALKLELPEDLVLPYEWAQESAWYWRVFRVPAALLNSTLGFGGDAAGREPTPLEEDD